MARCHVLLELSCELQSVHNGHHNVADYQFRYLATRLLQSLLAVGSLRDVVFILQYRAQIGTHSVVVVDDEHQRAFVVEVLGIGSCPPLAAPPSGRWQGRSRAVCRAESLQTRCPCPARSELQSCRDAYRHKP